MRGEEKWILGRQLWGQVCKQAQHAASGVVAVGVAAIVMLVIENQPNAGRLVDLQNVAHAVRFVVVFQDQTPPRGFAQLFVVVDEALDGGLGIAVNAADVGHDDGFVVHSHDVEHLGLRREIAHRSLNQLLTWRIQNDVLRGMKAQS